MSKKMENASRGPQAAQPFPPQLGPIFLSNIYLHRANQWSKLFGIGFSTYRKESNASAKKL